MHKHSTVKGIDGLLGDEPMVLLVDRIISDSGEMGYCTLDVIRSMVEDELKGDLTLILISLIARGHIHNVDNKYYPLGDIYQSEDGMYFTLEKPINKEEVMTDSHPRCIACEKKVTSTGVTKMCKDCEYGILDVLTNLEKKVDETGNAYIEAFAQLNPEDDERMYKVLEAYKKIHELMHYRQRLESMEKFKEKVARTAAKNDAFGKVLNLWWTHMLTSARFDLVRFHSISIKDARLVEWMTAYAKRKYR